MLGCCRDRLKKKKNCSQIKRKGKNWESNNQEIDELLNHENIVRFITVSYTHLDVYKRQHLLIRSVIEITMEVGTEITQAVSARWLWHFCHFIQFRVEQSHGKMKSNTYCLNKININFS